MNRDRPNRYWVMFASSSFWSMLRTFGVRQVVVTWRTPTKIKRLDTDLNFHQHGIGRRCTTSATVMRFLSVEETWAFWFRPSWSARTVVFDRFATHVLLRWRTKLLSFLALRTWRIALLAPYWVGFSVVGKISRPKPNKDKCPKAILTLELLRGFVHR